MVSVHSPLGKHIHSLGPALDNQHALLLVTSPLYPPNSPKLCLGSLQQVLSRTVPLREMTRCETV